MRVKLESIIRANPEAYDLCGRLYDYFGVLLERGGAKVELVAECREMVLLLSAFRLHVDLGDFGGFLFDTTCGGRVGKLKEMLQRIEALKALEFVTAVETRIGGIPKDEEERMERLMEFADTDGLWLCHFTDAYKASEDDLAPALARYLRVRLEDVEIDSRPTHLLSPPPLRQQPQRKVKPA